MKKILLTLLLAIIAAVGYGQDVTIDLAKTHPTSGDKVDTTIDGIGMTYIEAAPTDPGAFIYDTYDYSKFKITSQRSMAVVELYGHSTKNRGNELVLNPAVGTLTHKPDDISVWKGSSTSLQFSCASGCSYYITKIKIWYDASTYVPSTDGGEELGPIEEPIIGSPFVRTSAVPADGQAVKMAIVSIRSYEKLVKEYAEWKTQQGYAVEEIYAEDYSQQGQLTGEDLARSIQSRLKVLRPAFVLIVGDHEDVPAFKGTKYYSPKYGSKNTYVTDYFYGEYVGDDYFPEAYVGRFSGYNEADIKAQMDKTKYMATLTSANGDWLGKSLCILANDPNDATIKMGHDYTVDYMSKLGSEVTNMTFSASSINDVINAGQGFVTYYGHGGVGDLNGSYTTYYAGNLTNAGKYPVFLAMTCLTGTFDNGKSSSYMCLAEKMQRMPNAGTVAYVGATRESYLDKQFMTGGNKDGQTYLGFLRSMFPTTDEDPLNQHSRTLGEAVALARYGILSASKDYMEMGSEYHELFGDPTYQPYHATPLTMLVDAPSNAVAGHLIKVTAAPKAVVCVSSGRTIVAVGLTDSEGQATIKLAKDAQAGTYTLYCSAPNYTDWKGSITLTANDGQENILDEGDGEESTFDFNDFTRKRVLIEKFTGQRCPYCYDDDVVLKPYLADKLDKIYEMRHFAFTTDPTSGQYLRLTDLHNALSTTWQIKGFPRYLVDRGGSESIVNYEGYQKRAADIKNGDYVGKRLAEDCQVSLSLDGSTFNPATRQLKVVVSGKIAKELPDLRLNIFITQNGFVGMQTGYGQNYVHDGASRDVITNINGDVLETLSDNTFQKTYLYTVPAQYGGVAVDLNNMDVVAFVSSWDNYGYGAGYTKTCEDSEVYNTEVVSICTLKTSAKAPVLPSELPQVEEMPFSDGSDYNSKNYTQCKELTYSRDFTNTEWQALYVPFAMDYEEWSNDFDVAKINYVTELSGSSELTCLVIEQVTSGSTTPNTPYLIRAKKTGETTLVLENKTLAPAIMSSIECATADCIYRIKGTYSPITDMQAKGYYALSGGKLQQASSNAAQLKAQRWYLAVEPRTSSASATRPQSINILDNSENVTIIEAPLNSESYQADSAIYDLTGRKILPQSSMRGISIERGHKIIR